MLKRLGFFIFFWVCVAAPLRASAVDEVAVSQPMTIAHLFMIDVDKREVGLIDRTTHLEIPSVQVPLHKTSDQALIDYVDETLGFQLQLSSLKLIGRFTVTPVGKTFDQKLGSVLFKIITLTLVPTKESTPLPARVTHLYYGINVNSKNVRNRNPWMSIPGLYTAQSAAYKPVEPLETVSILKLMTQVREGKPLEITSALPVMAQSLKEKGWVLAGDFFLPPSFFEEYYKKRNDLQAAREKKMADPGVNDVLGVMLGAPLVLLYVSKVLS